MTGWWSVYASKDGKDMIWPDMIWVYIIVYDIWNFAYTYNCLPTHSWFCGVALLLAPTIAALLWNKGGWIQNRANTLCIWCMFAQVFPLFQVGTKFAVLPVLYGKEWTNGLELSTAAQPAYANPTAQGVMAILALVANVVVLTAIIKRAVEQKKNPYKNEIFTDQKDFQIAMARAEEQ